MPVFIMSKVIHFNFQNHEEDKSNDDSMLIWGLFLYVPTFPDAQRVLPTKPFIEPNFSVILLSELDHSTKVIA
jgi:hypothetical protein